MPTLNFTAAPGYTGPLPGGVPTSVMPTNRVTLGGVVQDLAGAVVGGLADRVRRAAAGNSGSEPAGSPAVPGNLVAQPQNTPCPSGSFLLNGRCVNPSAALPGGTPFITDPYGEAVKGMYGVALTPAAVASTRYRCPRGMVLGMDNLCYNRRDLRKDERKWVPPRKPLLTGGDLNAISRASRAASRIERETKRLQKLGMIRKPTRRR